MSTGALAGVGAQTAFREHLGPILTSALPVPSRVQRSVSDNTLVAMDFSGHAGRVIENPREALNAALEEAHAWRVRARTLCVLFWGTSLQMGFHGVGERDGRGEGPGSRKGLHIPPQPHPDP